VLTRLLEIEENQAVIIFTRTKTESTELAERLQARGHSAAALNGDMSQNAREKTINRLKKGELDILIATDVAARGIDVERVSHVINYDIPHDVDAYVHRIGRTGRAGRTGKAILFVTPREMRLFKDIEHHINKSIKKIEPPSLKLIQEKRVAQLSEKIATTMKEKKAQLAPYVEMVMTFTDQHACSAKEVAAALMLLSEEQNATPDNFSVTEPSEKTEKRHYGKRNEERRSGFSRGGSGAKGKPNRSDNREKYDRSGSSEKFERSDRSSSHGKFDRSNRSGSTEKFDRSDRSGSPEKFERADRSSSHGKFDRPDRASGSHEKFERPDRSKFRTEKPKFEKSERTVRSEKTERNFSDDKTLKMPKTFKDDNKPRSFDSKKTSLGKSFGDRSRSNRSYNKK
jgi:superfamily II DNA/RNA helicase